MATRYQVVGPLAVALVGGKRVTRSHGEWLPDGVDPERVAHLLSVGLIKEVEVDEPADTNVDEVPPSPIDPSTQSAPEVPATDGAEAGSVKPSVNVEDALADLDLAGLRAYAADHEINLHGARTKDEIRAAITAAQA